MMSIYNFPNDVGCVSRNAKTHRHQQFSPTIFTNNFHRLFTGIKVMRHSSDALAKGGNASYKRTGRSNDAAI
jgi:hypothetical protein